MIYCAVPTNVTVSDFSMVSCMSGGLQFNFGVDPPVNHVAKLTLNNIYLQNITAQPARSRVIEIYDFSMVVINNFLAANVKDFSVIIRASKSVTFTGNVTLNSIESFFLYCSEADSIYAFEEINLQTDMPALFTPSEMQEYINCYFVVSLDGIPFNLTLPERPSEYPSDTPIAWIVFGCCLGLIIISLVVSVIVFVKTSNSQKYTTVQ